MKGPELQVNGKLTKDHDMIASTFTIFWTEISESAVAHIKSSLRDSKAKDAHGLDTTF